MINFERYTHVNDIISYYIKLLDREDIAQIIEVGLSDADDAEKFSKFIWELVGQMNEDEESGVEVLGRTDNSDVIPDIHYEITKLMRSKGYYSVWERISNEEL